MTEIKLRKALKDDLKSIFDWRNHPLTRQYSTDNQIIPWADHVRWFYHSLVNPNRILLIGECAQVAIGVLRYDLTPKDLTAIVSIYLVPGMQGQGFGTQLLKSGSVWLATHAPQIHTIYATVLPANIASLKAFSKAGFEKEGQRYVFCLRREHERNQY